MLYSFKPKCKWQKENKKQLTQANSDLNFVVNTKTTTLNTAIAVDSNKWMIATRRKKANKPLQQMPTNEAAVRWVAMSYGEINFAV